MPVIEDTIPESSKADFHKRGLKGWLLTDTEERFLLTTFPTPQKKSHDPRDFARP